MSQLSFLIIAASSGLASPALAQVDESLTAAVPRCLEIRESSERLSCFERAARAILAATAETSRNDQANDVRTAKAPRPELTRELSAVIAEVAPAGTGYRLNLNDGSEWSVTNSSLGRAPAKGDQIRIERGVLSGYRATIAGKAGLLRVRRLR